LKCYVIDMFIFDFGRRLDFTDCPVARTKAFNATLPQKWQAQLVQR